MDSAGVPLALRVSLVLATAFMPGGSRVPCLGGTGLRSGERSLWAAAKQVCVVSRIAAGGTTGAEASSAISRLKWVDSSNTEQGDAILVFVNTLGFRDPLGAKYSSVAELRRDAALRLNINGGIVHEYLFAATPWSIRPLAHRTCGF